MTFDQYLQSGSIYKSFVLGAALVFTFITNGQVITDSLLIANNYRTFHFTQPGSPLNKGSLMFIMHGSGGNGLGIKKSAGKLEAIAQKENLLIVYPDGYKNYWNECRKYSTALANTENIDENAFFREMINYFKNRYHIDDKKVFAAGVSGGGHMAYKLGLTMPDKITAIAALIANLPDSSSFDCTEAKRSLPVLIINGTLDPVNPYEGGEMFVNNNSFGVVRSTDSTFNYWAKLAGYSGDPVKEYLPDLDPSDNKIIESYSFKKENKPEIRLLKVIGGKHDYPNDIDVYLYAWDFFKIQIKDLSINTPDPSKKIHIVEAACGQCRLGLDGKSCDLAVRFNDKSYFVDGTGIDDHGNAHAGDGFCEAINKAEVQGEIAGQRFVVSYFKLLENESK
ncbi:MAG: DUF6370 family protein [Chitinophagaceae bacterium]